jgi:hypothetical protein
LSLNSNSDFGDLINLELGLNCNLIKLSVTRGVTAGHLDEFCLRRKRMEKKHVDYARNSCQNEFIDFLSHISSRTFSHFSHGPNHRSYGFGSWKNDFVPRCFGFDPRSHRGARPSYRHGSPTRGVYSHFEPSRFDGPRFPRRDSLPQVVWLSAEFLRFCSLTPAQSH